MLVGCWYICFEEEMNSDDGTVNSARVEAVYLFNDNNLLVTKTKIYSKADGRDPEYTVTATGRYELSEGSTYENGTASVVTEDGKAFIVEIEGGVLTAMDTEFTIFPNDLLNMMTTSGK